MATAVYGGSPRHHQNRMLVNPNGSATNLQQGSNPGNIIVPPSPYLSSPVSLHHYSNTGGGGGGGGSVSGYASPTHPQHHHHHYQGAGYGHGFYPVVHSNTQMPNPLYASQRNFKRKSAVELLAESKAYYIKSETVLDRHQHHLYRSGNMGSSPYMASAGTLSSVANAGVSASTSSLGGERGGCMGGASVPNRRSSSSSSDLLQTKLRKLLNTSDSKETITQGLIMSQPRKYSGPDSPQQQQMMMMSTASNTPNTPGTFSYNSPKLHEQLSIHPEMQNNDVSVFFPSAFLSPQSLPPHPASDDDIYTYGVDDNLILTDDYRAISPPSEYAANTPSDRNGVNARYHYQRSYSHSHAVAGKEGQSPVDYSPPPTSYQISGNAPNTTAGYNINSHKSLPDLHSQISRHSPHSEVLSCCSRGNRSNKSGSSFNRDSGGSSGHYTHRSEPNCCRQAQLQQQQQQQMMMQQQQKEHMQGDIRRDSGSSTQHSGNSYYGMRYDCAECRSKMKLDANECLLNFTTPEVPEAFQDDDYDTKASRRYYDNVRRPKQSQHLHNHNQPPPPLQSPPSNENELSPPLGTFTRQRCLRFKNRGARFSSPSDDRRPILRSKSDISDRYWNKTLSVAAEGVSSAAVKAKEMRAKSESMSQLEHFFDRLGLNDEKYEEFIAPKMVAGSGGGGGQLSDENDSDMSSPLFFSDVSTVDSNRLPDSTETQPQLTAIYRPNEPPSIVERNARIIKWLCNCRKVQLT